MKNYSPKGNQVEEAEAKTEKKIRQKQTATKYWLVFKIPLDI